MKHIAHGEGGVVTPIKNEIHSTFSPNVVSLAAALADNKVISAESAGSTPAVVVKGAHPVTLFSAV